MGSNSPRWVRRAQGTLWYQRIDWGNTAYLLVAATLCAIMVLAVVIGYLHPAQR